MKKPLKKFSIALIVGIEETGPRKALKKMAKGLLQVVKDDKALPFPAGFFEVKPIPDFDQINLFSMISQSSEEALHEIAH